MRQHRYQGKLLPEIVARLALLERIVGRHGIDLTLSVDFTDLPEIFQQCRPGERLQKLFDPARGHVDKDNAFWLCGRDCGGQVQHLQAAHQHHMAQGLRAHLDDKLDLYEPQHARVLACKTGSSPLLAQRVGQSVYQGEMWLRGGAAGCRGQGLAPLLIHYGMLQALLRWSPDFLWAFIAGPAVESGLGAKYGYKHCAPDGAVWVLEAAARPLREWFLWMSASDLAGLSREKRLLRRHLTLLSDDGRSADCRRRRQGGHQGRCDVLRKSA